MTYREIGNAVAEWDDTEPLVFTISETTGSGDDQRSKTIKISLINLRHGFEDAFLLNLKEHLIERRNLVSLRSIDTESGVLRSLFSKVINQKLFDSKVTIHKSQGSQWRRVIVCLTSSARVDRSMIYTAITRAQAKVVICGAIAT